MKNETETSITNLMEGLNNKETELQTDAVAMETPDQRLRRSLLDYVSNQVSEVRKLDDVISLALNNLKERLIANEIDADKVLAIISTLSNKKTDLTTAVLEPFKATPNGTNVLLSPAKESTDQSDIERGIKGMSPDQLKLLDKMFRVLDSNKDDQ